MVDKDTGFYMRAWMHARNLHNIARSHGDPVNPVVSRPSTVTMPRSAFMTSMDTTRDDVPPGLLFIRRLCSQPWYRGICESDVMRIKRIKIQAGARNVRIYCGFYRCLLVSRPVSVKTVLYVCVLSRAAIRNANGPKW